MSRHQQVVSNSQSGVSMNHLRLLLLAAALAALGACQPKTAATAGDVSPPVATVDGTPISRDFYEFYIKGISGKTSAELPPEQRSLALDNRSEEHTSELQSLTNLVCRLLLEKK